MSEWTEVIYYDSSSQVIQMRCFSFFSCHVLLKHHHPVPMPTASVRRFRCTGMEATEMCHHWGCRRKEEFRWWRDAQRKKQVGRRAVYKEELAGPQSPGSLTLAGDRFEFTGWRTGKSQKGSLPSSAEHPEPSIWIGSAEISDTAVHISNFRVIYTRPPLHSASHQPPIGATVLHGDQHGHAACPFAAFGDGGVPPVSGYSLRLQGRPARAPPPLRPVWHHRGGGGGGLLQPGGGPGPEVVLADRGEPEEEHQMSPLLIYKWHLSEDQPRSDEANPDSQAEPAWIPLRKPLTTDINKLNSGTQKHCFHLSFQFFVDCVFLLGNILPPPPSQYLLLRYEYDIKFTVIIIRLFKICLIRFIN